MKKNYFNDASPPYKIDDQIDSMYGSFWFIAFYLTKFITRRIWTLLIKNYGIITPMGLYQQGFLTSGMKAFGAVFQRLMDSVFGDLLPKIAVAKIDDITIFLPN